VLNKAGLKLVKVADIPWEDRKNIDGWLSRGGMYYEDHDNNLVMRLIDYSAGSTERRHVHPGSHAAVVLKDSAIIDGLTLGPMDVILGPSNEPHGPLHYPQGCKLFSAFQGSYFHSAVDGELPKEKHYRLIESKKLAWQRKDDGVEAKTLVDHGLGKLLVEVLRFAAGAKLHDPQITAGIVTVGSAKVEDEDLGIWDFVYVPKGGPHGSIDFPQGGEMLAVTMR
jgi:hypothetical protein